MNLEQIDTSTTAGKAEVMRLAAAGRRVAYRSGNKPWAENGNPAWNWVVGEYAIIAEPVGPEEMFAVIGPNGETAVVSITRSGAERYEGKYGRSLVRYIRADLAEIPWEKC